jgi:putative restriction endonuclease
MATMTSRTSDRGDMEVPPFPPLQNGDRLTRAEFERRYRAMPHLKKAELLEGVVYIPTSLSFGVDQWQATLSPPVCFGQHSAPHFDLVCWLGHYRASTPGIRGGDNGSIRLDLDNMPQPDAFLLVLPEYGGAARISQDDYVEGAPELVAEVAASSVSYDLHVKLNVYRRNGVREYVVWRVFDAAIDWFVLREGRFDRLPINPDGVFKSEVFPGLSLDPAALVKGDMATVVKVLQQGIASPEHAEFVARLQQAAAG